MSAEAMLAEIRSGLESGQDPALLLELLEMYGDARADEALASLTVAHVL